MTKWVKIYSLAVNGVSLIEVDVECPDWLPVTPQLDPSWLRQLVAKALRHYFKTMYLKEDDTCASGETLN